MTPRAPRSPSNRAFSAASARRGALAALAIFAAGVSGSTSACGGPKGERGTDAAAPITQVALLDEGSAVLVEASPTRARLVAIADRLAATARDEGGTARGAAAGDLAGQLRLRAYRLGGALDEGDAQRARELWAKASERPEFAASCAPARRLAELEGELAHDAHVTYRALWAARKRLAAAPATCLAELDDALSRAAPFRPSPAELEALDRALAGQGVAGALTPTSGDAGVVKAAVKPARVVRLSRWSTSDSARVVIELDKAASWLLEPASEGRVALRLEGVELGEIDKAIEPSKGLLLGGTLTPVAGELGAGAQGGQGPGTLVALSLARPAYRRVFFLPDPFRVVIDLGTQPPRADSGTGARALRRVVLDPGHGGSDPGAIGPSGLREKDVTLAIAKAVAPTIARELGAEVRLTRGADAYVSLEERAAAGNAFEADVFLSIHCNAAETKHKRGVEVYVLDTARDELANRVAARENGGGSAAPGELRAILDDLKLAELGNKSHHFAELLLRSTMASLHGGDGKDFGDVADGGVHGAGFFVLVGARMPAALIEVSFISNPTEEGYLARADYRARVADAIVNALRAYKDGK
jgi:N-acetylmuramoyl-L-alanine amidase